MELAVFLWSHENSSPILIFKASVNSKFSEILFEESKNNFVFGNHWFFGRFPEFFRLQLQKSLFILPLKIYSFIENGLKIYDIGDVINQKDRIHFLDSCSRFGNVFVGRQNGFDLYAQADLEKSEGNAMKMEEFFF